MIDKTIKNIKKILWRILEGIVTAKIPEKKYFTRFWREQLQEKQQIYFLSFLCIKRLDVKMANITMRSYLQCEIEVIDKGKYF